VKKTASLSFQARGASSRPGPTRAGRKSGPKIQDSATEIRPPSAGRKSNCERNPISVCFVEQNPISLNYLVHLLPPCAFQVASEEVVSERPCSSIRGRLVLVFDEKVLTVERRLIRCLSARFPEAKLLILGTHSPCGEGCQLLYGVDGFVLYADVKDSLIPALCALCDGHLWLPTEVLEYFVRLAKSSRPQNGKSLPFTSREAEVIRMLSEGLSNKEIGNNLGISERTVKFHVANVFAKLGAHDRSSAIEIAHSLSASKAFALPTRPAIARLHLAYQQPGGRQEEFTLETN
jgi:DNA-binding NarL/FixJ family response regulator